MKPNIESNEQALLKPGKYERKRTANLESLIGNLKVRKLSQGGQNTKNKDLTSLYVEVTNSLSDCSRSTPPLSSSSPSVSPSSISPDSPIQCNVSSSLSSTSSSSLATASNKSRALLPKFRWMMESSSPPPQNIASKLEEEPDEEIEEDCKTEETNYHETSSLSPASDKQKKSPKTKQPKESNYKITSGSAKSSDDPSRAVKFYDDFIDFRGDILRRPPNSKNCRILWEYLFLLLQDTNYSSVIKWEDESKMVFRIVQAEKLAALWGLQKNRLGMTYEKLSRGMRYYYPNNIIAREPGRRLLYRFMRHPDEIKKFVKKNGTYMLKKSKQSGKKDSNGEDSGADEPKKGDELDEDILDEENSREALAVTQENNQEEENKSSTPSLANAQFYSEFYQYMYSAQMAAAMGLPNYGVNAAQYLMQLRNQAESSELLNESLKSLASSINRNLLSNLNNKPNSSSSSSSSSSTHSLELNNNNNNNNNSTSRDQVQQQFHPLNLALGKKRKSKYDITKFEDN